ncbi:MAG: HAD family hydrolase [Eubacteriales bacterium]|nr:HAD family hydrolase [Eubacteriales bacterium]
MENHVKIISLDLDGTLLNFKKEVSERNQHALKEAAEKGIYIVPTTGRIAAGLPDTIKSMPFVRYVIGANGAVVTDMKENKDIMKEEIPNAELLEIFDLAKKYDVLYDCYVEGSGYISADMMERVPDYTMNEIHVKLMHDTRKPVDNLDEFMRENGKDAQKVQFLFRSEEARDEVLQEIKDALPNCLVTNSYPNNIEINSKDATKGNALKFLCEYLGIDIADAMSFGDGTNDISMLDMAGIGVAMENAAPEAFNHGKIIAPDCNEDGVARIIEQYVEE